MPITRANTEIRTQAHQMDAEGSEDVHPTSAEIFIFLAGEGFIASNIDIHFDNLMKLWAWTADIEEAE